MPEVVAPADSRVAAGPRAGARIAILFVAAVVACLSVAGMFLVASPPASAHDQLLSSDPADADVLDAMPGVITLTFSGEPLETGAEVILTAEDGTVVGLEDITADGTVLTASVPATLPGGAYDVAWHIVSGDGHPLEGAFSFTADAPDDAEPSATPEDSGPADTPEESADAATGESAEAPPAEQTDAAAGAESGDSATGTPVGIPSGAAALAVIAAVAVVVVMLVAMRRRMKETEALRGRGQNNNSAGDGSAGGYSDDEERSGDAGGDAGGDGGSGSDGGSGGGD